jgi:hypothetical protein
MDIYGKTVMMLSKLVPGFERTLTDGEKQKPNWMPHSKRLSMRFMKIS